MIRILHFLIFSGTILTVFLTAYADSCLEPSTSSFQPVSTSPTSVADLFAISVYFPFLPFLLLFFLFDSALQSSIIAYTEYPLMFHFNFMVYCLIRLSYCLPEGKPMASVICISVTKTQKEVGAIRDRDKKKGLISCLCHPINQVWSHELRSSRQES